MEKKPASSLVVSLGKALNGTPPPLRGRQVTQFSLRIEGWWQERHPTVKQMLCYIKCRYLLWRTLIGNKPKDKEEEFKGCFCLFCHTNVVRIVTLCKNQKYMYLSFINASIENLILHKYKLGKEINIFRLLHTRLDICLEINTKIWVIKVPMAYLTEKTARHTLQREN